MPAEIARAVAAAITEAGTVKDSASDAVKRTRARVATLEGRLRAMLNKREGGEVTSFRGRMCVAVALGACRAVYAALCAEAQHGSTGCRGFPPS